MAVKQIIFKYVLQTSSWLRPTMSDMCWHAFEHSLQGNTGIWLKETENNKNYEDKVIIRFFSITYCCFKTSPSFPKHPSKYSLRNI